MYRYNSFKIDSPEKTIIVLRTCSPYVTLCYSAVVAVDQLPVLPHSCSPLDGCCAQVRPDIYMYKSTKPCVNEVNFNVNVN